MPTDQEWMAQALALAEQGRGQVEPNPLVGAVVVRDGQLLGAGWHQRYGGPHAEVNALAAVADPRGATLYVTLEPCCHQGKTPPCTDAILRAGIPRVVAAMLDPFPEVSGKGIALLRAAGVAVTVGVGEAEAQRLNAPYLKRLRTGRPHVHAKWAMTLDGKIATHRGHSQWISNPTSRARVHHLRGQMDAILVGIGTALADNPTLTARPPGPRTPVRVVLDRTGRLPLHSTLVQTAREVPTLLATCACSGERRTRLEQAGVEVLVFPEEAGRVALDPLLVECGRRRWTNLLVEGGAGVLGSFLDARAIDEVHVFVAPLLAGGAGALSPLGGVGAARMDEALRLAEMTVESLDGDLYIHGRLPLSTETAAKS